MTGLNMTMYMSNFITADDSKNKAGGNSRERKDSFYWYQKVVATNGEDLR